MGKSSLALSKVEKLMSRQLQISELIACLKCKIRCALMLSMFNQALRSIRDTVKIFCKMSNLFLGGFDADVIRYVRFFC